MSSSKCTICGLYNSWSRNQCQACFHALPANKEKQDTFLTVGIMNHFIEYLDYKTLISFCRTNLSYKCNYNKLSDLITKLLNALFVVRNGNNQINNHFDAKSLSELKQLLCQRVDCNIFDHVISPKKWNENICYRPDDDDATIADANFIQYKDIRFHILDDDQDENARTALEWFINENKKRRLYSVDVLVLNCSEYNDEYGVETQDICIVFNLDFSDIIHLHTHNVLNAIVTEYTL